MNKRSQTRRRIALFVEGQTERGDARRRTLPGFFHKWLDPQLPRASRVGITAVSFQGVSNFLDDLPQKVAMYLENNQANFVFGLIDLYGIPQARVDLSQYPTTQKKVEAARAYVRSLVPSEYSNRFRQHFAVHEVEAWLLAYPERWQPELRSQIAKRPPETVNFDEPPAKFLNRLHRGHYKKTTTAMNLFPIVDPKIAVDKCPYLKLLMEDLLRVSQILQ
jgi:Domain of unknown function (DUF4276)